MRRRIDAHVVMEKIIPRITEEYRKLYDIPEDHESMAVFSADCEDVMWLAVDDATRLRSRSFRLRQSMVVLIIPGADMGERLQQLFPERKLRM